MELRDLLALLAVREYQEQLARLARAVQRASLVQRALPARQANKARRALLALQAPQARKVFLDLRASPGPQARLDLRVRLALLAQQGRVFLFRVSPTRGRRQAHRRSATFGLLMPWQPQPLLLVLPRVTGCIGPALNG